MAKKVIVAEDYDAIRIMIGKYLTHKGLEVDLCENGEQMLEKMTQTSYDAVLTDYELKSHLDGLQVLRRIRVLYGDNIPVYFMSGRDDGQIFKDALMSGATDFIHKPFKELSALDVIVNQLQPSHQDGQTNSEQ